MNTSKNTRVYDERWCEMRVLCLHCGGTRMMLFVAISVSVWYLTAAIEEPMLQYVAMSVNA